jgi:hypothetical protein
MADDHYDVRPATWTERRKAARIVKRLRDVNGVPAVARFFAMKYSYIVMIEHMTKRIQAESITFHCPSWAVHHILNMDLMKADISEMLL